MTVPKSGPRPSYVVRRHGQLGVARGGGHRGRTAAGGKRGRPPPRPEAAKRNSTRSVAFVHRGPARSLGGTLLLGSLGVETVALAHRLTLELEEVGVVDESVADGVGGGLVAD